MVIKIGRVLAIIFSLLSFIPVFSQTLELRVISKQSDAPVTTLTIGVPYRLELKAEGAHDLYNCTIPGIEKFHHEFCGASHVNYMSYITTVHSYVIRADTLGSFVIGPVTLTTKNGETITSNSLTLHVEKQDQSDIIVELVFDTTAAVVGQRLEGMIRINSSIQSEIATIQNSPIDPELGSFVKSSNIVQAKRTINGKQYSSFEVPVTVLFKKPGRFSLPKIGVLCKIPNKRAQRMWSFGIFQSLQEQWFYSTDPVIIDVKPLPALSSNQQLLGVGQLESISLHCKQKTATCGEGVVAILDVIGKEGVEDIQVPPLNLPQGLKYYDSKVSCTKEKDLYKKSFEYIIQATQDHNFEIQPQAYTYYDTQKNSYKTLKTAPIQLLISSGNGHSQHQELQHENEKQQETLHKDDTLMPIKADGPWFSIQERAMSLWWFCMVLLLIIILAIVACIIRFKHSHTLEYSVMQKRKNAFKNSRKRIGLLKKSNDYTQLYDVFNQLFKDRYQLSLVEVSGDVIEEKLQSAGFMKESVLQWNRFFMQLAELAYCRQITIQRIPDDLFNRALMWINQLEEKL